jgi:carboxymethylenebutenolidase
MVDIATADGTCDAYLAQPDGDGPHAAVLLFSDAIGLRQRIYDMADRIASHGYVVLAPNLFYRSGRAPVVANLDELLKAGDRQKLMAAVIPVARALKPADAMRDTRFYLDYLASVSPGPVGLTGYCMGAGLALRTAAAYPDRVAAAGGFHGGNLASDADDSPHLLPPA